MKGKNTLIVLIALTVTAGCAAGPTPHTPAAAPSPTSSPTSSPASPSPAPTVSVSLVSSTWSTSPVSVTHSPPVPPVPVVTGIRYAAHPKEGYDRIVLDIPGRLPGYSVKYVPEVRRDGSGEVVTIPGKAFLLIVLNPAQAHRDDGTPTVTGTHRTGLTGIQAYAVVGDYEGYTSIALGISGVRKFHVGELSNRLYLDVAV
jgi:hypothetical protein